MLVLRGIVERDKQTRSTMCITLMFSEYKFHADVMTMKRSTFGPLLCESVCHWILVHKHCHYYHYIIHTYIHMSNLLYKSHQISELKCFSFRLVVAFAYSIKDSG